MNKSNNNSITNTFSVDRVTTQKKFLTEVPEN